MAKRTKEDEAKKTRIAVQYPKFKTLEAQIAFQIGLALAFNALARVFDDTTDNMLEKGEDVLKNAGLTDADVKVLRNARGGSKE